MRSPALFPNFTQLTQAPLSAQAIPNASLPLKSWFWDPSKAALPTPDADGNIEYLTLGAPGSQLLVVAKCPASIAEKLNLPGTPAFPVYVIEPTTAVIEGTLAGGGSATAPLPPNRLSTLAQAEALAEEFNALAKAQDLTLPSPFVAIERDTVNEAPGGWKINYNGDSRRVYVVAAGGSAPETNVGEWIELINGRGAGYPVSFKLGASLTPELPVSFLALNTEVGSGSYPAPAAPLAAGERILWYQTMFDSRWIAEYISA